MKKLVALAVLVAAVGIASPGSAEHVDCFDGREGTFAKLLQPKDGNVQIQTGPTGPIVAATGGAVPSVSLSTTGTIEVKVDYACLKQLTLTVTKDGAPFYSKTWETACEHAGLTHEVPIGLDAGNFQFQLSGTTCSGAPTKGDGHGGFVMDPPIL